MAIYKNERFEIPKGTYKQKQSSKVYIYQYTEHYRCNEKGKAGHTAKAIGVLDEQKNLLIPNDNFFELNSIEPRLFNEDALSFGYTSLCTHILSDLGVITLLKKHFSAGVVSKLLTCAMYCIGNETSIMNDIDDWMETTYLPQTVPLITSQSSSRLFQEVGENRWAVDNCKKDWASMMGKDQMVCYDVTSLSSYSNLIVSVEYGYNRDHEKLPQINLGMFCSERTKMPLTYACYEGSVPDKTELPYILELAESLGLENLKMVLDGGFCEPACFSLLEKKSKSFTVGVPGHRELAIELASHADKNELTLMEHMLSIKGEFGTFIPYELYGVKGRMLIGFNQQMHTLETQTLSEKLIRLEKELSTLKRMPKASSLTKYSKYFHLSTNEKNKLVWVRNTAAINEAVRYSGFFFIFTNDTEMSAADILYYYRTKDADEKLFYQLKIYLEANRLRVHSDAAVHGKLFMLFIAQILRTALSNGLRLLLDGYHLPLDKAMKKMANVRIRTTPEGYKLLKAPTKLQKEMYAAFVHGLLNEGKAV
ncbi:MAG: transposase [Spirochaetes bacterium]|nr:transposase [Spirochaetota bacterium]